MCNEQKIKKAKSLISPTPTLTAFTGVTNAHWPYPSQLHAGLHLALRQLREEVTRSKARFKSTLPKKSGVDGRQCDQKKIAKCL